MRLFVAVKIPGEIRRDIWDSTQPLREVGDAIRWVAPEGIHLTFKFLGEVPADREDVVGFALDAAAQGVTPFVLPLGGFGAFPSVRRAKVIWAGCESTSGLRLLQRQVEEKMAEIGFAKEARAFHPHLTLGRIRRNADVSKLKELVGLFDQLNFSGDVFVRSVELMQSELSPTGASYTVRRSVEFSK